MNHFKAIQHLFLLLFVCTFFSCSDSTDELPYDLRCEYLVTPIGVDVESPRLTWKLPLIDGSDRINNVYVWISSDSMGLVKETKESYRKEFSGNTTFYSCADMTFEDYTTYYWKVGYKTAQSDGYVVSEITSFTTGIREKDGWKGKWISDGKDINYLPSSYFRRSFNLNGEVKKAWFTIASAGLHEISLNGEKVGDHFLDPMYTRFDKRVLSVMHDVTSYLLDGENVVGVQLGNGWYNHQSTAVWFFEKAAWRGRPCFMAQLRIEYEDGGVEYISTDSTWLTADSPVIFNSIYTAEHYDSRKEINGWNSSGYDASSWKTAELVDSPTSSIVAQLTVPIREIKRYNPERCIQLNDSTYVYHFPQNIAGIIELTVKGEEGQVLYLKHGEMLYPDGRVNMENIDYHYRPTDDSDPFQTDIVILSGREDHFSPKFNYKGFQYVEVTSSSPITLSENNLVAVEMHSDVPQTGYWNSSSELLNKIWEATNSSYLANLFGYPTDCPQREKNGWTGDAHINMETALYNFDAIAVYEKWMNDFLDEQRADGVLPCIIPTSVWGYDWANGVDWTCAVALIPWDIYRFYGDATLLKKMYPAIKKYVSYIESIADNNLTNWGLGDWIPVEAESDVKLTTSIYYYAVVDVLVKAAKLFEYTEDVSYYTDLAVSIRSEINNRYFDEKTGVYASGTQTELSMPLYWGIVPEEYKMKVAENLNDRVVKENYHLNVGLLGSKSLLSALSDNGYVDTAYKIATQQTYPSWGYWIVNGATTLYENWKTEAIIDNSLNHIMFGEIGAWLYRGIGGIQIDESQPGFKHILLKPYFPEDMDSLHIDYNTPYGKMGISWERRGENKIVYSIEIPNGTFSTITFPDGTDFKKETIIEAGKHSFELLINR